MVKVKTAIKNVFAGLNQKTIFKKVQCTKVGIKAFMGNR